jgi:DNA-binding transcriptional ArsR family regulator
MVNYEAQLDLTFTALAHSARRAMLARLGKGEATVGELAMPLALSPAAITKHLKMLEKAKLISRSKNAQWRPCHLEAEALTNASEWIEEQRTIMNARLDRLENYLHELQKTEKGEK